MVKILSLILFGLLIPTSFAQSPLPKGGIRQITLIGKPKQIRETEPIIRKLAQDIGLSFLSVKALAFRAALNRESFDEDHLSGPAEGSLLLLYDDQDEFEATLITQGKHQSLGEWPLDIKARSSYDAIRRAIREGLGYDGVVVAVKESALTIAVNSPVPQDGVQGIIIPGSKEKSTLKEKSPKGSAMIYVGGSKDGLAEAEIMLADPSHPPVEIGSKIIFK